MTAVQKVAVVGSGVSGLATAILLARAGVEVDVFEAKPELPALGSGITVQGNALRVLDALGAWDAVRERGYAFDGLSIRAPGPGAPVVAQLPDVKTGGPDYPACLGMHRPDLAAILVERAEAAGARLRFGARVTGVAEEGDAVVLEVGGAAVGRFDLVVGADGLHSTVRSLVGIETRPEPTGMGIWRTVVSRPAEVAHSELYYGGPVYIAGYTPTSDGAMYAFLVERAQDRFGLDDAERTRIMLEQSLAYGGPWERIRDDLQGGASVNYTWFTQHLVPAPWNRGRVVVIGDAAHSCPPTIAQGAAQGLEDALVLAELLVSRDAVDDALWDDFHGRRLPRVQQVVDASVQIGRWQIEGDRDADPGALIGAVAVRMAEPA